MSIISIGVEGNLCIGIGVLGMCGGGDVRRVLVSWFQSDFNGVQPVSTDVNISHQSYFNRTVSGEQIATEFNRTKHSSTNVSRGTPI